MPEISKRQSIRRFQYVPVWRNQKFRMAVGFILIVLSVILAAVIHGRQESIYVALIIIGLAWLPAVFFTAKYEHKYPQRYYAYLVASHLKAAVVMALFLWIFGRIAGSMVAPPNVLWSAYIFFVCADDLVSIPRRKNALDPKLDMDFIARSDEDSGSKFLKQECADSGLYTIDAREIIEPIRSELAKPMVEFIEKNLPAQKQKGKVVFIDDVPHPNDHKLPGGVNVLVGRTRINDVRRLNNYLEFCVERIAMGGYIVIRYIPLENVIKNLKDRYRGLFRWPALVLHFIWYRALPKIPLLDKLYFSSKFSWIDSFYFSLVKKRNRALSKAEAWGRLAYHGMNVIAESGGDTERYIMAQRISKRNESKITSYYPIVALEKVGLNGQIVRMHKFRTMFPFSEFLQKRIYEDHGLAETGKFKNDFRLTGLGKLLRKYWLDELPQIFDWLRGDVKLVGMRATSKQFLSLYPKEVIELYIQIKPGLVPPIFDESTNGFDQIVAVELKYLKCYWAKPFLTDVRYLVKTIYDIVFRGIRSK